MINRSQMSQLLDPLVTEIEELKRRLDHTPVHRWATVASVDPLTVRLDGDDAPLFGTPDTLVSDLSEGSRVMCVLQNRRVTIIGTGKGLRRPPIFVERTYGTQTITASSFVTLPMTNDNPVNITVDKPTLFNIRLSFWKGGSGGLRLGIMLSGATSQDPDSPAWGAVARDSGSSNGTILAEKDVIFNPGTTRVRGAAYRESTTAATASYQYLSVKEIR